MMTQAEAFQQRCEGFTDIAPTGSNLSPSELALVKEMAGACVEFRCTNASAAIKILFQPDQVVKLYGLGSNATGKTAEGSRTCLMAYRVVTTDSKVRANYSSST